MTLFDWHGRHGHLGEMQEAELSEHLASRVYRDVGEVRAHIVLTYGTAYSHSGCIKLMHRLGFECKRPKSLPTQADEAKQAAFIEIYEKLQRGLADDEAVYFVDAVHPEYQSRPAPMAGSGRATRWRYAEPWDANASICTVPLIWKIFTAP